MSREIKRSVTLKDIAKKSGFSMNTVSHALKDKNDISEKTKKEIKKIADELGYIQNASASFLRSGISKTVAIIVGDISNPHFAILVKEMETFLQSKGYTSFVLNANEDEEIERQAIMAAISQNVDGIIISPCENCKDNLMLLKKRGIPFVLLSRKVDGIDTNYVICDDINGGYVSTKYLLDTNYRNVFFFNGPEKLSQSKERLEGYKKALSEYNIPFEPQKIFNIPLSMEESRKAIKQIVGTTADFDSIVAFNDMFAWQTQYLLKFSLINSMRFIPVLGFDNINAKYKFPFPLTSVSTSNVEMSIEAVKVLLECISNPTDGFKHVVLETKLIIRDNEHL